MELKDIKKQYSKLGIAYTVLNVLAVGSAMLAAFLIRQSGVTQINNSWITYLLGIAPIWVVGFPVCYLMVKNLPVQKPEEKTLKPSFFVKYYPMIITLMFVGNIIGRVLSFVVGKIFGGSVDDTTMELIRKQEILPTFIFVVLIGPIFEELAFRKILIDRLGQYSKRYAIVLSGFMFGLFHTNIYQLFYAWIIGMMFAYVYTISGKIKYTMILHGLFNFVHGFIPVVLIKHIDFDKINEISSMSASGKIDQSKVLEVYTNPAFVILLIYILVLFAIFIAGIVLLALHLRDLKVDDSMSPVTKENHRSIVYGNPGIIIYIVVVLGYTIFEMVRQLI